VSFLFGKTLDGFIYDNVSDIEAKVSGFKNATTNQLQVVLDFDRTLTMHYTKNAHDSTSWQIMRDHLPMSAQGEAQLLHDHYRNLELCGMMSDKDARAWWASTLRIIVENNLDLNVIENDFVSKSTIRPGTKELFELCKTYNIPTVVMSAGVKNIINMWCRTYDIQPTIILSTELQLDSSNHVIGWDEASVVHMFNKHELDHPELSKIRAERSHTILVGDSIHDHSMAAGDDTVFRIRVVDPYLYDAVDQKTIKDETFKLFDAIIENQTLTPVVDLIKSVVKK
jgi:HAD superfamily phosphoserine phosphatase-like hydrolase